MTLRPFVGSLALAVALAGCATAPPYDPFLVPEAQVRQKVKRIALAPIAVPPQLGVPDAVKQRFDILIEVRLREAGFVLHPAKDWGEVFNRMLREAGGVFDQRTGEMDEARYKAVWTSTAEEIGSRFLFDAVLLPRVQIVRANWGSAWANWDGVSEALASGVAQLLAPNASGTLPALSLVVSLSGTDFDGPTQYRNRGGIQVLQKLTPLTERFSGGLFAPVPREELLANEERNLAAIEAALGPLVKKP